MNDGLQKRRLADDELVDNALVEIMRQVQIARGRDKPHEVTPWDFDLPTRADLRQLRNGAGLSRQYVADTVGYSQAQIGAVERGEQNPSFELVVSMLRLYKMEWPR